MCLGSRKASGCTCTSTCYVVITSHKLISILMATLRQGAVESPRTDCRMLVMAATQSQLSACGRSQGCHDCLCSSAWYQIPACKGLRGACRLVGQGQTWGTACWRGPGFDTGQRGWGWSWFLSACGAHVVGTRFSKLLPSSFCSL